MEGGEGPRPAVITVRTACRSAPPHRRGHATPRGPQQRGTAMREPRVYLFLFGNLTIDETLSLLQTAQLAIG